MVNNYIVTSCIGQKKMEKNLRNIQYSKTESGGLSFLICDFFFINPVTKVEVQRFRF